MLLLANEMSIISLQLHVICKITINHNTLRTIRAYSRVNRNGRVVLEPENELYSVPDIVRRRRETRQSGQPALHCGDNLLFCWKLKNNIQNIKIEKKYFKTEGVVYVQYKCPIQTILHNAKTIGFLFGFYWGPSLEVKNIRAT